MSVYYTKHAVMHVLTKSYIMEKMTKAHLQDVAKRKGITFTSKTTKEDLTKLIKEAEKAPIVGNASGGEY